MKAVIKASRSFELAGAVEDIYRRRGFTAWIQQDRNGRFQVWVHGQRVVRNSPSGKTVSHGGKVPRLLDIAPLYVIANRLGLIG